MAKERKHVVIIGGGFGGVNAAKILGRGKEYRVTIIDRRNHHLFQPLLYQVAMAALSPAEIAYPIRSLVRRYPHIDVLLDEVVDLKPDQKEVVTKTRSISYDYLIMACGSNHSYFGNNEWEEHAPGLKTLGQATEIRRRVLLAFEKAANEKDIEKQRQFLTFVIVGGGPTGVELAGSIAELSRLSFRRDFKNLDTSRTRVILLEGAPQILNAYPKKLSYKAALALEKLGVQVWTNAMVTKIESKGVYIGDDEFVKTSTVLWAAGVAASPLNKKLGSELDRGGRVIVGQNCQVEDHPEVFVIGDQAHFKAKKGDTLPGLAPVAIQQGQYVAKYLNQMAKGKKMGPFHYIDKGQMATIGRNKAVLKAFGIEMSGMIAWFAWLFVHILYLIGFRNRMVVLFQWAWAYLTFKKGARLIIDKEWRTHSRLDADI
ncbi:NAD(P)/FAD-dependent oxidoreductase [Pseudobacteriovorax antillogorgiicola]|uniref:NADH:ubiquinone reductase (non-electrogenic) n=1 Tax=Pseudobacteriovorax antillogorgiicola TaxID=1513793 RepID=A0A1Y6C1M5_9BACT|nr:NAD(P)/FAD-dependent oxidoreductase [Pseudobacteriovorax antillogorgiicola]TCS51216.1 NADH dehydrogenase [Pseudobacteriovorax antillogorgiicola]SMF37058.1 NADH dehydrogenase [Pseudobacteriovorax antillogorgiicola]